MAEVLGLFEQVVLLSVLGLGKDAYGRAVFRDVQARLQRDVAAGAVYATLDRLEGKSLLSSRLGAGTAARGGRSRRYYTIENAGLHALNESKAAVERIWLGFRWPLQERKAMNRRHFAISAFAGAVGLSTASRIAGQNKTIEPDLVKLADGKGLNVFNRSISSFNEGTKKGVRLSENPSDGVAFLPGIEFANGAIEFDVKGKDVQQQSFVGVAFHGVDGTTYDAVYFRPFNFRTEDAARRIRAVQYVSHPTYPWQKLRTDQPGKYEKAVNPVPDPNAWFHVRVVVASPKVSVFVADAKEPSLVVDQLSDRKKGLVGLWVGNTSGGDFANFKIIPA